MIEIAPGKLGYFYQIVFKVKEQPFSFSRVTLILLQTLGKFESALVVTNYFEQVCYSLYILWASYELLWILKLLCLWTLYILTYFVEAKLWMFEGGEGVTKI